MTDALPAPRSGAFGPTPTDTVRGTMPGDVAADLAWRPGSEFTLGAEDELLLVDRHAQLLGPAAVPLMAELCDEAVDGAIKEEIFVDEVELATPACTDADELRTALGRLRGSLAANGGRTMAIGVHPSADCQAAVLARSPRYDRLGGEFAGLLRTPTASFQVHVGLPDPASALRAYRGLRNRLSILRALAAGSPYWHARDSGLASIRPAILRSYPRTTMPPALHSWEEYQATIWRWASAHEVPDYTYMCWELRPQPRLGTLEVRVMDAQPSLARAAGLAALVQGLARHAVETPDHVDLPDEAVLANDFRACRYGLEATVLDVDGSRRPVRELAARVLDEARRQLAPNGLAGSLDAVQAILTTPPEYVRQRALCEQRGMAALLADLVARTTDLEG